MTGSLHRGLAVAAALIVVAAVVTAWRVRADRTPNRSTRVPGTAQPAAPDGGYLVGYFAQWGVYARNYHVRNAHISGATAKLTHLMYAFGSTTSGRCAVGDKVADHERAVPAAESVDGVADDNAQPLRGNFNQLRKLKQLTPHLKILWSFGGWNGSAGFADAARYPAASASSCRDLLDDPRWAGLFDGIDMDWEYPNACGKSCDTSYPGIPRAGASADTAIGTLLRLGIPARKLLLGVAFHARGWTGVDRTEPGGTATGLPPAHTNRASRTTASSSSPAHLPAAPGAPRTPHVATSGEATTRQTPSPRKRTTANNSNSAERLSGNCPATPMTANSSVP